MGVDLHRHDEFSSFDGLGKAMDLARVAKSRGLTSLGISNHGTVNGLVEHYLGCKEAGIKPILGVEAYFQPEFNFEEPDRTCYHLCLFAKNLVGYQNLNKILSLADRDQFYYKAMVTYDLLEKYSEGIICTSACVAGYIPNLIYKEDMKAARKHLRKHRDIFGDDFYIEIQPYKLKTKWMQETINKGLIELADELDIKCILTSDSHYGAKEDYPTYIKMHKIAGHEIEGEGKYSGTYTERYMPSMKELHDRFVRMHWDFKGNNSQFADDMLQNLEEIESKVVDDIFEDLELVLPKIGEDSYKILVENTKRGLKEKGVFDKAHIDRCKQELEVIKHHGFEDYFLIVQDYVKWAKDRGIAVGPGRGSVCNCEVAHALDITEVDAVRFNLDFRRFLRMDKKKLPDVDLDFETDRRHEVINYIVSKYKGKAAQIISYGLYKVDNLINDLAKVCNVTDKAEILGLKSFIGRNIIDDAFDYQSVANHPDCKRYNKLYDDIVIHFSKMFKKVRYIGTHAAGVAVVGDKLLDHTMIKTDRKDGSKRVAYDLNNLDHVKVIKFDILGLRTMSILKELETLTGDKFSYEWLDDPKIYEQFRLGNTDGIFQFEKKTAQSILQQIETDCAEDVIAASALNRPGPLSLKMPDQYAANKQNIELAQESVWYEYTKNTYGTIVYQEQIIAVCVEIGRLDYADADRVLKFLKGTQLTEAALRIREQEEAYLRGKFRAGCKVTRNLSTEEADELFDNITVYSFNQGHATGYGLISIQQMYYKVYYPQYFWYVTMKYAGKEEDLFRFRSLASVDGEIIMLPHVNLSEMQTSLKKFDGEYVIHEGLNSLKGIGEKAAEVIVEERKANGRYKDLDDFLDRLPKRTVNSKVVNALLESGALVFDKKAYINKVKAYNSSLYQRGSRNASKNK